MAFPIPDDAVRDYLVKTSLSDDQHVLKTNYLKLLGSVFTQVNDELERCREELEKQIPTAGDLAKWWSRRLEGRRTELYKAAIDGARNATQVCIRETARNITVTHCIGSFFPKSGRGISSC